MGAEEVSRTTALLGRKFELREPAVGARADAERIATSVLASRDAGFVLLDVDEDVACDTAKRLASPPSIVVLHARVQSRPCPASWLSLRLPRDSRDALLKKSGIHAATFRIDEWDGSLVRFGAGELNERYKRRTHAAMDGDAWAGWFAIKAAAEAALRLDRVNRAALTVPGAPAFDGHKGVPLRFGASGVLEQPVYVIEGSGHTGRVVREIS